MAEFETYYETGSLVRGTLKFHRAKHRSKASAIAAACSISAQTSGYVTVMKSGIEVAACLDGNIVDNESPTINPTYAQAQVEILGYLVAQGWQVKAGLKIPHATSPNGELRLWFKPQAVYFTEGDRHEFGDARTISYDLDTRKLDGPSFLSMIERRFAREANPVKPMKTNLPSSFGDTEIHTWFERDRSHVELRDKNTDETIIEWWDDDVAQAVEDGCLNPKDWHRSAYEYAQHVGITNPTSLPSGYEVWKQSSDYLYGWNWRHGNRKGVGYRTKKNATQAAIADFEGGGEKGAQARYLDRFRNPTTGLTAKGRRMERAIKKSGGAYAPSAVVFAKAKRGVKGLVVKPNPKTVRLDSVEKVTVLNPNEAVEAAGSALGRGGYGGRGGKLWMFQFGAYGDTLIAYWDIGHEGLEGSLEEVAGYLADHAPGHIHKMDDPILKELIVDVLKEKHPDKTWEEFTQDISRESWAQDVEQEAFADLTYTESGYLTSYEWYVDEIDPGSDLFRDVFAKSLDEAELEDDDWEKAKKVEKKLGLE